MCDESIPIAAAFHFSPARLIAQHELCGVTQIFFRARMSV
jgi:hypothetical protein